MAFEFRNDLGAHHVGEDCRSQAGGVGVDEEEERQQDRNDVAMGVMRLEEYRAKWYGETLEEAVKNLPEPALTEE